MPDCIPAQRLLSPGLWKFQHTFDAKHVFELITPHRDVSAAEDVLSGFSVGALRGDYSVSDPLRVYFALFHLQLINEHRSIIARSANHVLWVHPHLNGSTASGHEGDSGYVMVASLMQAAQVLNAVAHGALICTAGFVQIMFVMSPSRPSTAQGNWMPGQSARASKLNIALHAQSKFELQGFVSGSEVTTAGMMAALQALPSVGVIKVFAPFAYDGILDERCAVSLHA